MKIITVSFDYRNDGYTRLSRAFKNSVDLHMPDIGLTEYKYDFNETQNKLDRSAPLIYNTFKLDKGVEILKNTDENLALVDCDMLMTDRIDDVGEYDFDVAYTYRQKGYNTRKGIPYNGGVLFVRPNERSIRFFERWSEINKRMLQDSTFHVQWRSKYAGINQSAFGYLIELENDICEMKGLPCPIGNSVNESWDDFNSYTKLVHIKSKLRKYCLEVIPNTPGRYKFLTDMGKWFEKLDQRKETICDQLEIIDENVELQLPDEKRVHLSVIIPKINDPHLESKIKNTLYLNDELFVFRNIKQNYNKLIEKCKNNDILFINPGNYRLLNKPEMINEFRLDTDEIVTNKKSRPDKSSFKIRKTPELNSYIDKGVISFRFLLKRIYNLYNEKQKTQAPERPEPDFDGKLFIPTSKLEQYCNNESNSEVFWNGL